MKKAEYYSARRDDLIKFVPKSALRILEVGCGEGLTGRAIRERRREHVEVIGIEKEVDIAEKAKSNIDRVIVSDVETAALPFENAYFDCIMYGEVLEHLVNPWDVLKRHCGLLKIKGLVIASIPNIAHYRTIKMLRKGEWRYEEGGILDRDHLRFFTLKSIKAMFQKADLTIIKIEHKIAASRVKKALNTLLSGALSDYITEQYIIVAEKTAA